MMLDMIRFPYLSGDSCKAYRVLAWRASGFQHAITDEIAMEAVVPARCHPWPSGPPFSDGAVAAPRTRLAGDARRAGTPDALKAGASLAPPVRSVTRGL